MNKTKIAEGVNLYTLNIDKFKTFTMSFYFHRQISEQEASLNALLPFVMKRGSRDYPDTAGIFKKTQELYGGFFDCFIRKKGEDQIITFNFEFVAPKYIKNDSNYLSEVFEFASSLIFNPLVENGAFKASYVEREKENLKDYIEGIINDKKEYANLRCIEEMCKGEPYAIYEYGTPEGLSAITPEMLYNHYKKVLETSVIDVFVIGDADVSLLEKKLKEQQLKDRTAPEYPKTEIQKPSSEVNKINDRMDVNQGKLSMGFTTGTGFRDSDCYALTLFNSVFGSGAHSKLFNNVREKLSLCYYAYSRLDKYKGIMTVNSGIEFENFKKAYDEILAQLENIKNGDISDEEMSASVKAVVNLLRSLNDSAFSLEDFHLGGIITGEEVTIDEYIAKIEAVTKEDIVRVASKIKLNTVYALTGKGENEIDF